MAEGYGRSVWCLPGFGLVTGRYASGRAALIQSILRRLQTPRGTLRNHPDALRFGLDLPGLIGSAGAARAAIMLPGMIGAELRKDQRIASASARVTVATQGAESTIVIVIDVAPADDSGSFALTLTADAAAVALSGGLTA
jgi:hypothetical protein